MKTAMVLILTAVGLGWTTGSALADGDVVKLGIVTSLTGQNSAAARDLIDGVKLGIKRLNGQIAGMKTELSTADDQEKPEIAREEAARMVESKGVEFLTGPITTNLVKSVIQPVTDAGGFFLSTGAGPSAMAGKDCEPNFFVTTFENVTYGEVTGQAANDLGLKNIALLQWNSPGARDLANGFKKQFKGTVDLEIYTPPSQLDFAGEIGKLRTVHPDGYYFFFPSQLLANFMKQLNQFDVGKDMKGLSYYISIDPVMLQQLGDIVFGQYITTYYSTSLDNPANKDFVDDFKKEYGNGPGLYAAHGYDLVTLLDHALKTVRGRLNDRDAVRKALEAVKFESVRGSFKFNTNHFPIENFYLTQIVRAPDGSLTYKVLKTYPNKADSFAAKCKMGTH